VTGALDGAPAATHRASMSRLFEALAALTLPMAVPMASALVACGGATAPGPVDAGSLDLAPVPYTCPAPQASSAAPPLPGDACDLLAQDCPADHGCYPGTAGATCLPAGAGRCAGPCQYANDCPPGTACVGEPGRCRALCVVGEPCAGDTRCRPLGGRDQVGFCPPGCHVLLQDCDAGWACVLMGTRQECAPAPPDGGTEGAPCAAPDACEPGLVCQDPAAPRCLAPCTSDGAFPCVAGACREIDDLAPLGVCADAP